MRSEPLPLLVRPALCAAILLGLAACTRPPAPAVRDVAAVPDGWFPSSHALCDAIRRSARAADDGALRRLEIPESLWTVSTWMDSDARAAARDPAHEQASREFARWLHEANDRKGRQRLIQALREDPDTLSGCPAFVGDSLVSGPLVLHAFGTSPGSVRLAGSLARLGGGWRVHSFAEAGTGRTP